MEQATHSADLVVVGGGFGGAVAALRARELGLSVILVEQGEGDRYLCNSRMSGGIIHVCLLDIRRTPDELFDAILKATNGEVNREQARAVSQNAGRLVDWLQAHGGRFVRFNEQEAYRWCMAPPRALVPGPDWIGRGPDNLLRELIERFKAAGGTVMLATRALSLVMEDGACKGLIASRAGGEVRLAAGAVLIADGGFQADQASFAEHIGPHFNAVFQRGAATSTGDGMRMAAAVGARMTSRRPFYGHLLCGEVRSNPKLWPYPELDAFATAGVIVGLDGRRIANESAGGIAVANALAQLPNAGDAVAIFDSEIWAGPGKAHRIPANPLLEHAGATIYRAHSIEDLARQLGVAADALAETIATHNAAVDSGSLDRLTPPRRGPVKALPIRSAPFMAIKVMPGITYTMGGIEVDGNARVISTQGVPIPGLLAAGAATGGLEGGGANAYIGGIAKAGVYGLLAAEEVARIKRPGTVEVATSPSTAPPRFPMLGLIVRHGEVAARILALLVAIVGLWLAWPTLGVVAIPLFAVVGGLAYALLRSYVEIVTVISEMLIPR